MITSTKWRSLFICMSDKRREKERFQSLNRSAFCPLCTTGLVVHEEEDEEFPLSPKQEPIRGSKKRKGKTAEKSLPVLKKQAKKRTTTSEGGNGCHVPSLSHGHHSLPSTHKSTSSSLGEESAGQSFTPFSGFARPFFQPHVLCLLCFHVEQDIWPLKRAAAAPRTLAVNMCFPI